MEKFVVITYLFDFYQELLTDKQRDLLRGYYFEDFSLSELAEQHQISRQSAFDTIKKAEHKMLDYEQHLGLFDKYKTTEKSLAEIKLLCEKLSAKLDGDNKDSVSEITTIVNQLLSNI